MAQTILILFISLFIPLAMSPFFIKRGARVTVIFLIVGLFVCMFAAYINGYIAERSTFTHEQLTFTVTPLVEEIMKAIPIIIYAFLFQPKRRHLLACAVMTGIGFAILENAYILTVDLEAITVGWAIIRGLGAGLMHGVCTLMIGYGLSYVNKVRKMTVPGTYALIILAIVYHACYNMLIQSEYRFYGIILPILTLLPILIISRKSGRVSVKKKETEPETEDSI